MPVAAKTRPINLTFKPRTPQRIIHEIQNRYSHYVVRPDNEEYVEWEKTDLARELDRELTPGVLLRLLREAHDLSQAALGEKINSSAKRVSDFETGQRAISKDIAKRLAVIFNVSPARFI
jgi:ribosome-binding protein aMBF1 (putative translation factor)